MKILNIKSDSNYVVTNGVDGLKEKWASFVAYVVTDPCLTG